MPNTSQDQDPQSYTPEETERRRDKVLGIMLHTPPQPHVKAPPSRVQNRKKVDAAPLDPGQETPDRDA